jgi:hypothetical protein
MQNEKQSPDLLADIRHFLQFLQGLYGLLSGITLLFPLSNALIPLIPVANEDKGLFTILATLISIFAVFYFYASADAEAFLKDKNLFKRRAIPSGLYAISSFVFYIILFQATSPRVNPSSVSGASGLGLVVGLIALALYACMFVAGTSAFIQLALHEYFRKGLAPIELAKFRNEATELASKNKELHKVVSLQVQKIREQESLKNQVDLLAKQNRDLLGKIEQQTKDIAELKQAFEDEQIRNPLNATGKELLETALGAKIALASVQQELKDKVACEIDRKDSYGYDWAKAIMQWSVQVTRTGKQGKIKTAYSSEKLAEMIACHFVVVVNDNRKIEAISTKLKERAKEACKGIGLDCEEPTVKFYDKELPKNDSAVLDHDSLPQNVQQLNDLITQNTALRNKVEKQAEEISDLEHRLEQLSTNPTNSSLQDLAQKEELRNRIKQQAMEISELLQALEEERSRDPLNADKKGLLKTALGALIDLAAVEQVLVSQIHASTSNNHSYPISISKMSAKLAATGKQRKINVESREILVDIISFQFAVVVYDRSTIKETIETLRSITKSTVKPMGLECDEPTIRFCESTFPSDGKPIPSKPSSSSYSDD